MTRLFHVIRLAVVSAVMGALALGVAWGGVGLAPAPYLDGSGPASGMDATLAQVLARVQDAVPVVDGSALPDPGQEGGAAGAAAGALEALPPIDTAAGLVYVGAHKVSIHPEPDAERGHEWIKEGCDTLGGDAGPDTFGHLGDLRSPWPENPGCIYVGGYGIGPTNSVKAFDEEYGLWARSIAFHDGDETVVLTILDAVYWMGRYATMCDRCGAFDLAEDLGAELGFDPAGFYLASTHSHTAPDFIGGWGGVPEWYMEQTAEAIRDSVRGAIAGLRPAVIEAGEVLARQHNGERRNTYRSAEEAGLSWLRAVDAETGATIATLGAYAAHPTTFSVGQRIAHADWPGVFANQVEARFGGVGLHFMTGLGNMSARGGTLMGFHLANLVPDLGGGAVVASPDIRTAQEFWQQPVTNGVLTALAVPGFFDRPFSGPATVSAGKSSERQCRSASPVSVETAVSVARIGSLVITGAPGEVFSNWTNTVKERTADGVTVTFPLGVTNDALGYINQSFEAFPEARQGLGFAGTDVTEYEDAYSLDQCFGDKALETVLSLLAGL
jgi:hypothetical protein